MADHVRILLLDDEDAVRRSLGNFLEDAGFAVAQAQTAEEALGMLQQYPVDIAIVDLRLPGMDGDIFIVQAHMLWPDLAFIIYTGSVQFTVSDDLKKAGITRDHVFQKPLLGMNVMVAGIEKCLRDRTGLPHAR